ncbi:MAG: DUF5913 domain-containing protein, partial [Rhodospirillales bacterium]|nr:DUF5913 domain-containing protein [Rhodospirillales bacterium]
REQYLELGHAIIERAFSEEGYSKSNKALKGVLKHFHMASADDLAVEVGAGHLTGRDVVEAVYPALKKKRQTGKVVPLARARAKRAGKGAPVPIKGLIPGMALHFAGCCHPLPGDRIVGIVTTGRGVTIHTIDCETLAQYADMPDRWLDVSWEVSAELAEISVGRIHVTCLNAPGSLGNLSTLIAKNEGNISNLKITNRSPDFFEIMLDIEVRDVRHLTDIIAALRATPVINSVERARG